MQGYHYIVVNSSYIDCSITLRNTYALIGQLFLLLIMNTLGFGRNKKKCNTKYYITLPHIDKIRYIFFLIRNNLNEKEEGKIIYVKFFLSLKIYKKRNDLLHYAQVYKNMVYGMASWLCHPLRNIHFIFLVYAPAPRYLGRGIFSPIYRTIDHSQIDQSTHDIDIFLPRETEQEHLPFSFSTF